jgi:NAD(P)-dependent dehydrogenase (short-subunit alcohol dehydrogenase family)
MNKNQFMDKFQLPGKVALVTGGSRGIGRAISLGLAEAGADIILASRKLTALEMVAHEISQMGRKSLPIAANIRHLEEIDNLIEKATAEFGRIDILVNNAATNPIFGSVFDIEEKTWDVTLNLNLKACFFLSQKIGKMMRGNSKGGSIINIASEDGIRPRIGLGVYAITKAGLIMLTSVLAEEWGQYDIRVNALAPGVVKTRLSEALWKDPLVQEKTKDNTALARIAEPEEMVGTALFLASDASSYITGQTILLDGGHFSSVNSLLSLIPK